MTSHPLVNEEYRNEFQNYKRKHPEEDNTSPSKKKSQLEIDQDSLNTTTTTTTIDSILTNLFKDERLFVTIQLMNIFKILQVNNESKNEIETLKLKLELAEMKLELAEMKRQVEVSQMKLEKEIFTKEHKSMLLKNAMDFIEKRLYARKEYTKNSLNKVAEEGEEEEIETLK